MRRICRTDSNQREIVEALRKLGCSVQPIHQLGQGAPDILIGYAGTNFLFEVKDGGKSASRRRLTADEEAWHKSWRGQIAVVNSVKEALELVKTIEVN